MPTRSTTKGGIEGVGCLQDGIFSNGHEKLSVNDKVVAFKEEQEIIEPKGSTKNLPCLRDSYCCDESSSSSSIGKNSDLSENSNEKSADGEEVQSSYKGPLDAMEALEQVLPIRRGISRFYNGKSKSYASLADASASSIAKPENAYTRKRRNLLACSLAWDKTRTSPLRGNNGGGISKRANNASKTTLALAVAMTKASEEDKQSSPPLLLSGSSSMKDFSSWRSFSMVDLQQN